MKMVDYESKEYKKAEQRVESKIRFYKHLSIYIIVNILLLAINYFTSPGTWWFYWVSIIWGIFVVIEFIKVILFPKKGSEWKEKEIEKELKK
jgi:membrane protein YdbS with pleckstrin-like domain